MERTIVLVGNEAGSKAVSESDSRCHSNFSYNDHGRGGDLKGNWKTNDAGLLTQYSTSGNDNVNAPSASNSS